ncbi:translation initiation factor IF-2 subunit beta [Methanospirillum stamsii]|uniref:Translation initiation factor 2 subunit beta n=1 Tax=Methanospirillum stamsii TaxID=1277351 RepID=A0A2V2N1L3_9EURY|nr:translation initiation factor IF-2 subunit beta [Methanospirillum stamsii]PWR73659.1 translation initiation factor IF-2 subunit beta [Methanospirillum stamsii]
MVESYEALLNKAYEEVTEPSEDGERWSYPEPRSIIEGKTTILENFSEIVSALRRDADHLMKFLLGELGTAGKIDGSRAIFNGKFEDSLFSPMIRSYVDDYVICSECGKPDTRLFKDDRVLMLKCEACGSHRPVRKRKSKVETGASGLEAGNVIEVSIESTSRRGDGVAKVGKYIVYVAGGRPGQKVKVRIAKISGSIIFTEKP